MKENEDLSARCSYIKTVTYKTDDKILEINFKRNNTYQYFNVPALIFNKLIQSDSPGKYFRQIIRNNYEYIKLS